MDTQSVSLILWLGGVDVGMNKKKARVKEQSKPDSEPETPGMKHSRLGGMRESKHSCRNCDPAPYISLDALRKSVKKSKVQPTYRSLSKDVYVEIDSNSTCEDCGPDDEGWWTIIDRENETRIILTAKEVAALDALFLEHLHKGADRTNPSA